GAGRNSRAGSGVRGRGGGAVVAWGAAGCGGRQGERREQVGRGGGRSLVGFVGR
ncbi:hypothetical protein KI387_008722, partial [Taxus chinensis]